MTDDLHNANDLIEELSKMGIDTTAGRYVKVEDVERLIAKREAAKKVTEAVVEHPKTIEQARGLARKYLKENQPQLSEVREPGRSIPANESQPPSRALSEGLKGASG